jgi:ubiquinone/menaquinone biosynthesis C-methylase UbiE
MGKNVREGQMNNYINNIASVGEWVRLDHQARLVGKATGLLPALFDDMEFTRILDVGCGPGQWALDIAANRSEAEVTGIDLSTDMMNYANARAQTQHLKNVSFIMQDFMANKLPFPEQSFDLINLRFAVGWLKNGEWLLLLSRCFVMLKPGGYLIITEGEGIYTTSPALERLQELLCQAFFTTGYGLSHSPHFLGVVAHLGYLLHETGFRAIHTEATMLDFSYYHEDQEANRAWRDGFHALISESAIFLFQAGVTTAEELALLDAQISIEMFQEDFCGLGPLFTFSAQKPAGETTDEQ